MVSPSAQREQVAEKARKRDVPSTGAINKSLLDTQKKGRDDAVYNGRPNDLTAPPLAIYHSVFAKFEREITAPVVKSTFTSQELQDTHQLTIDCEAFYMDENARRTKIEKKLPRLVHSEVLCTTEISDGGRTFKPDGFMKCECPSLPED